MLRPPGEFTACRTTEEHFFNRRCFFLSLANAVTAMPAVPPALWT
jgi:hypothetical protein